MSDKYFMIANGSYCHIFPDKIILGQPATIVYMPEMDHKNRNVITGISAFLLLIMAAVFTTLYLTDRMLIEVWIGALMIVVGTLFRLYLFRDTSNTQCITRSTISSTKLVKRYMGYTTWVVFFTNEKGQRLRRLINIYDTREMEARAEKMIREAGLL